MELDFTNYKSLKPTMKPNLFDMPINHYTFTEEGCEGFNKIYMYCKDLESQGLLRKFKRTKSGGISIARPNIRGIMWDYTLSKSRVELVLRHENAHYYRFMIGYKKLEDELFISGNRSKYIWAQELEKDGVVLDDYAIENGEEIKAQIPKPKIEFLGCPGRIYNNAHHLDLNSSYASGIAREFPEFAPTLKTMYSLRKVKKEFKSVLTNAPGYFQSKYCNYKFSHICKAGHDYTHEMINMLTERMKAKGCRILAYNTDGIWYQSENIYHDELEGALLGQWKTDHTNCTIRFKSKGSYEFIENEQYTPVVRGYTNLDKIKPRDQWQWGDIFDATVLKYEFDEEKGVILQYDSESDEF